MRRRKERRRDGRLTDVEKTELLALSSLAEDGEVLTKRGKETKVRERDERGRLVSISPW